MTFKPVGVDDNSNFPTRVMTALRGLFAPNVSKPANLGATYTVDCGNAAKEFWVFATLTADCVITIANRVAGSRVHLQLLQDGTGNHAVSISDGTSSSPITVIPTAGVLNAIVVECPDATNLIVSPLSLRGPKGDKGDQGNKGDPGTPGTGGGIPGNIFDVYLPAGQTLDISTSASALTTVASLTLEAGTYEIDAFLAAVYKTGTTYVDSTLSIVSGSATYRGRKSMAFTIPATSGYPGSSSLHGVLVVTAETVIALQACCGGNGATAVGTINMTAGMQSGTGIFALQIA